MIAGKYRVEGILGKGGMGIVVAATHVALRQRVAVKFLLPETTAAPEAKERFFREARTAALIRSEHVARVADVGMLENGAPYLVMEYLTGIDLRTLLEQRRTLPATEAVDYILQACEAIAQAHAVGVVHRDLKPSNLFLAEGTGGASLIKVLDFGISKNITSEASNPDNSITETNVVMGSFLYMAPEQVRGVKNADMRSDIWALGVILFQLITGRRPFEGSVMTESLLMIAVDPPPTFQSLDINAPTGLEAVIGWCLEKDRERRPQSIADLVEALEPFGAKFSHQSTERMQRLAQARSSRPDRMSSRPSRSDFTPAAQGRSASGGILPMAMGEGSSSMNMGTTPSRLGIRALAAGTARAVPRTRFRWVAGLLVAGIAGAFGVSKGCRALSQPSAEIDVERLASFAALPSTPPGPDSALRVARTKLGRALFHERKLSRNGDIACSSCHALDQHGVDGKRRSRGTENREPPRNTLSVYNTAGAFALMWDGRMNTPEDQVEEAVLEPTALASSKERLEATLRAMPAYVSAFKEAFPEESDPVSLHNVKVSIATFEGTLFTRGRWDRFLEGDKVALNDDEKAGFNRFVEVGCISCHFGANVGATMFQKVGLVKAWPDTRDRGRYEITRREADWMVFKVPSLRNVEKTGPYFHDGSVNALDEAIRLMGRHQIGRELEETDVSLILTWLKSLTGELPRDAIEPPAARN